MCFSVVLLYFKAPNQEYSSDMKYQYTFWTIGERRLRKGLLMY